MQALVDRRIRCYKDIIEFWQDIHSASLDDACSVDDLNLLGYNVVHVFIGLNRLNDKVADEVYSGKDWIKVAFLLSRYHHDIPHIQAVQEMLTIIQELKKKAKVSAKTDKKDQG